MAKSKFFRAFVEGQTISDGRTITAGMIEDVVATFNVDTYTPRINIEHISGYSPEPPFNGYGDVIAVKAQDDDFEIAGKTEKRKALYCQVEGNDQLVKLSKAGQKPFPSVELTPAYAGVDKVGLIGLAFTDKPASIGTQKLSFSRSAPGTFFSSAEDAVALEFEVAPADSANLVDVIANAFSAVAARFSRTEPEKPKEEGPKTPANDNFDAGAFATGLATAFAPIIAAAVKPANDGLAALSGEFTALKTRLENTDGDQKHRAPATGGGSKDYARAEC